MTAVDPELFQQVCSYKHSLMLVCLGEMISWEAV
jgi:hypothetical protein